MKRLLPLCLLLLAPTACIDSDYDLSELETDRVGIGGDESEFAFPLATLRFSVDDLNDGTTPVTEVFDEVDTWLPTRYASLDLERLSGEERLDYVTEIVNDLFVELEEETAPVRIETPADLVRLIDLPDDQPAPSTRFSRIVSLLYERYRSRFDGILPFEILEAVPQLKVDPAHITERDYRRVFIAELKLNLSEIDLKGEILSMVSDYFTRAILDIGFDDFAIDPLDLGDEVTDLLADPDDGAELTLYGSSESTLPIGFRATIGLSAAPDVRLGIDLTRPDGESALEPARLSGAELRRIVDEGSTVRIALDLRSYDRTKGFDPAQEVRLTLRIRKKGGLVLNL